MDNTIDMGQVRDIETELNHTFAGIEGGVLSSVDKLEIYTQLA